jgi:hypothetical protein
MQSYIGSREMLQYSTLAALAEGKKEVSQYSNILQYSTGRGVEWRGVVWRGVVWRGVTWRGVARSGGKQREATDGGQGAGSWAAE